MNQFFKKLLKLGPLIKINEKIKKFEIISF